MLHVVYQVGKFKINCFIVFKVIQPKVFKVSNQYKFGEFVFFKSIRIVNGLRVGSVKVFTPAFHFY